MSDEPLRPERQPFPATSRAVGGSLRAEISARDAWKETTQRGVAGFPAIRVATGTVPKTRGA